MTKTIVNKDYLYNTDGNNVVGLDQFLDDLKKAVREHVRLHHRQSSIMFRVIIMEEA